MKSILLTSLFLVYSISANAKDDIAIIQSLMNDVCSTSQNVPVCMFKLSAAVKLGINIGKTAQLCEQVENYEPRESNNSSVQFVDALFDTNRKAVESVR